MLNSSLQNLDIKFKGGKSTVSRLVEYVIDCYNHTNAHVDQTLIWTTKDVLLYSS